MLRQNYKNLVLVLGVRFLQEERRSVKMTKSYLSNLQKTSLEKEENISQMSGLITYKKIVEARGEYQTTQYSASKPLDTS